MAEYKSRLVNTHFWDDKYTSNLDPIEKLLFLYFLTNPLCNIIGIYEIEIKRIAFDTGIDKEMVNKIIERFTKDEKVAYLDGYIIIKNFVKFQSQGSEKIKIGISNQMAALPEKIKKFNFNAVKGIDTLSHINTNINTNSNLNSNPNSEFPLDKTQAGDFVDSIILLFQNCYHYNKGIEYISVGKGKNKFNYKDRNATGSLLKYIKSKYPGENSELTLKRFESLFNKCFTINDTWLKNNMTLDTIFNKLNNIILYGQNGNKEPGASTNSRKDFDPAVNQGIFS